MASTSKTPIKVFFNDKIKKKFEEVFSIKPFIFDKYFDVKEELNFGFTLEFMSIVVMHKWEYLIRQKGEIFLDLVQEFYALLIYKDSPFLMIQGTCVRFDVDYINDMFGLTCQDDEHESFQVL
ncbi:hypothetical protein V6N11_034743 [Hibiscus sabdariffa]|uniref:Uncharacterized protein n=2 Tax=Hibiscus sabdariffa TaxID=183260 RepID=A0ABR2AHL0_9ROSI